MSHGTLSSIRERNLALSAVAAGRKPADLVIRNTRLVNVNTAEILEGWDIAVCGDRIALIGDASHTIGEATRVFDARGQYAVPAFMDGHLHIESSMLTVKEYARCVIPHGTSAIFPDPHEIANVLGLRGIEFMLEDAADIPLRVYITLPSCVPALPGVEDGGASISVEETETLMKRPDIHSLGEMMNYPGVIAGDEDAHGKIAASLAAGKVATGHYASPEIGKELNAYTASGIRCCHESVKAEQFIAKMRLGMYVHIREGSAWKDLAEGIKGVLDYKVDTRLATLASDDSHPASLLNEGHMDHIVRRAISEGLDPVTAIQMATINTAQCFRMEHELGSISPGRFADILILSDLEQVKVEQVYIGGKLAAEQGKLIVEIGRSRIPSHVQHTVKTGKSFTGEDFRMEVPAAAGGSVKARVIAVKNGHIATEEHIEELGLTGGCIVQDTERDILKLTVIDRHRKDGTGSMALVRGFSLREGAAASTYAHDAHNLTIIGASDDDMAVAGNALAECGGGMVVVRGGRILALLPLSVAGLMSEAPAAEVAEQYARLSAAFRELGCTLDAPFHTMSMLSLAVVPALRLTNRGLIDTDSFEFVPLFL